MRRSLTLAMLVLCTLAGCQDAPAPAPTPRTPVPIDPSATATANTPEVPVTKPVSSPDPAPTTAAAAKPSPVGSAAQPAAAKQEYPDFASNEGALDAHKAGVEWVTSIAVTSPAYRADVKGDVAVAFIAPGMVKAKACCWQQPTPEQPSPWGHDVDVAVVSLDPEGKGAFVFPAEKFPNGPISLRIYAQGPGAQRDVCELQLWNQGGVVWNQGLPASDPPAAKGMKLLFADDFDKDLSISRDGKGTTYCAHTPWNGDFSGWKFSDPEGDLNPFSRRGTFLRIHAEKRSDGRSSSGIISAAGMDATGTLVSAPFYMECRFTAQSAPGTWPAFWAVTTKTPGDKTAPSDELDIVEAYGGVGPKNPNHPGYSIASHFWKQNGPEGKPLKGVTKRVEIAKLGGGSYWSTTFHTYGLRVDATDTVYYYDDIEVLRHPTGKLSATKPFYFLINYAIGGISGWKIDLARYGDASDMYVDWVRVYAGAP